MILTLLYSLLLIFPSYDDIIIKMIAQKTMPVGSSPVKCGNE